MNRPEILVEPPGPRAKAVLQRSEKCFSNPKKRTFSDLVISEGRGAFVKDIDGNTYLDFTHAVSSLGHSNPVVAAACHEQAIRFMHTSGGMALNVPSVLLAEGLQAVVPIKDSRVLFCVSGTEACDYAIGLSNQTTGRRTIASYSDSYHGLTSATLAISGEQVRGNAISLVQERIELPYPYCYRCPYHKNKSDCGLFCIDSASDTFESIGGADRVAAVFIEPLQVHGGLVIAPNGYLKELANLCRRHGILLVDDEVWTGFGRTGKFFAIEHFGVEPDVICLGKSLGFGFPMAAVVAKSPLMDSWDLARAVGLGAFGGHAACAAGAKAGLDLVLRDGLVANAERLGRHVSAFLDEMHQRFDVIGDVRSMGLLGAFELVEERTRATPAKKKADSIVKSAFKRGLLVARGGKHGNVVRFAAPITVTEEQLNEAFRILNECLKRVLD